MRGLDGDRRHGAVLDRGLRLRPGDLRPGGVRGRGDHVGEHGRRLDVDAGARPVERRGRAVEDQARGRGLGVRGRDGSGAGGDGVPGVCSGDAVDGFGEGVVAGPVVHGLRRSEHGLRHGVAGGPGLHGLVEQPGDLRPADAEPGGVHRRVRAAGRPERHGDPVHVSGDGRRPGVRGGQAGYASPAVQQLAAGVVQPAAGGRGDVADPATQQQGDGSADAAAGNGHPVQYLGRVERAGERGPAGDHGGAQPVHRGQRDHARPRPTAGPVHEPAARGYDPDLYDQREPGTDPGARGRQWNGGVGRSDPLRPAGGER